MCVSANACTDVVFVPGLFVLCIRVDTYPIPLRENGRSLYIFSFNALASRRDLALHLAALLRDCLPIFATLVIEPLVLRRPRQRYGWSYNLSAAIGNSLIKFRIADRAREMNCTSIHRGAERKESFLLILTGLQFTISDLHGFILPRDEDSSSCDNRMHVIS